MIQTGQPKWTLLSACGGKQNNGGSQQSAYNQACFHRQISGINNDGNTRNTDPKKFRMSASGEMTESEFHRRVDLVLAELEASFDDADVDIDAALSAGILTLTFENNSKIIINRQTANREIWVAAKSGGFHFRFDGASWRDTRSNEQLESLLSRVVSIQCESAITITLS